MTTPEDPESQPSPSSDAPATGAAGSSAETTGAQAPAAAPGGGWSGRHTLVALLAVVALVAAGCIGGLIVHWTSSSNDLSACDVPSVANEVLPSVVTISVRGPGVAGSGSGEIIRSDGYVLTNDHVISAGAASGATISVLLSSGDSEDAIIVGRSTPLDLAVLKIQSTDELPVIDIGNSDDLQIGQPVVALGAPLGLDGSVTAGIVSALGRDIVVPAATGGAARIPGGIQTDASINPGNSGGALVDCGSALVGINTAIATVPDANGTAGGGSVGIGFAIPVDLAMHVADELISNGAFIPPTTGMSTAPITAAIAKQFGVPAGLFVLQVVPGGPADQAGMAQGDIITEIDGASVSGPEALLDATLTKQPGDTIALQYQRDDASHQATLTLAAAT